jgi:hypothetical protein
MMDRSQQLRIEGALRHLFEILYNDGIDADAQKVLFSRSGNRARLSTTALDILAGLEIKIK